MSMGQTLPVEKGVALGDCSASKVGIKKNSITLKKGENHEQKANTKHQAT